MVSIVAFQAIDPGSIPGQRIWILFCILFYFLLFCCCAKPYMYYTVVVLLHVQFISGWGVLG